MTVGVEGDFDRAVAHLIAHVRRRLTLADELACKEVSKVMKAGADHPGMVCYRSPDFEIELIGIDEPASNTHW